MNVRPSLASKGGRFRSRHVPSHVPSYPQTAAKARPVSRAASGFTAETDWLLEGDGVELSSIQRAVSYSPTARARPLGLLQHQRRDRRADADSGPVPPRVMTTHYR
jgi:hypothetical protein